MTALDIWFIVAGGMLFMIIWGFALIRLQTKRHELPEEVRKTSHDVKNEVMQVRAGLKAISRSPDPVKALISAMTGRCDERDN